MPMARSSAARPPAVDYNDERDNSMTEPITKLCGIRVLIFDLDGTLVDSSRDLANAVNAVRVRLNLPPHPLARVISYIGHGARELVRKSIADVYPSPDGDFLDAALAEFRAYYAEHLLDTTQPYPTVRETLMRLCPEPATGNGYALAVLTNKPLRFTLPILEGLDLARYFRFIFGEESLPARKPDPVGVHRILSEVGAKPREAVIIGDSDTDVLTARNAGIWSCGVTYGLSAASLAAHPPDIFLEKFSDLLLVLNDR
jgi:phosphoglycolate phosphatase